MALTESNMLPLGTVAPDFRLPDTISGKELGLNDLKSDKATVIMFLCNHCPFVLYLNEEIVNIAKAYQPQGVSFIGISSNDVENYPADSPEKMTTHAAEVGYSFPYLYDESQEVAKAYDAACTPDFYVFDGEMKLSYCGRLDASRPGNNNPIDGADLRKAIDAAIAGKSYEGPQLPSAGCNIKWKK